MMFGYATDETEVLMPAGVVYTRKIRDILYCYALAHPDHYGIDIKTQVTLDYGNKNNFFRRKSKKNFYNCHRNSA